MRERQNVRIQVTAARSNGTHFGSTPTNGKYWFEGND